MRITVLDQYAKGPVQCDRALGEEVRRAGAAQVVLWHGDLHEALHKIDDLEALVDNFEDTYPQFKERQKAVQEFCT
jgi:hypothetical protein